MKIIMILCTVPDLETARHIATVLLEERLAACVSLLPGWESHYTWDGKQEIGQEVLLKIKTQSALWDSVKERILAAHPYQCPEILCFEVSDGFPDYLDWVRTSTTFTK